MTKARISIAGGLLALAFAAAVPARAEKVCDGISTNAAFCSIPEALAAAKPAVEAVKKEVAKIAEKLTTGPAYRRCPPGTHESQEGEEGVVCRSDNPASVTCEIDHWELRRDDSGEIWWPVLGKCDPKGGWAGDGPRDPGPQAP